jgi:hypothetical protein
MIKEMVSCLQYTRALLTMADMSLENIAVKQVYEEENFYNCLKMIGKLDFFVKTIAQGGLYCRESRN